MKHTKEETKAFVAGWVSKHKTISDENAALKAALAELIPIAERMQATCKDGESKCYDNEWDAADAIEYKAVIDRAKELLNKQPQSESDRDKNLS